MKKLSIVFILAFFISCTSKEVVIENVPFLYGENNGQPNLISSENSLTLSWISSPKGKQTSLYFTQFKEGQWIEPTKVAQGSDWFVNWADFPAIAINKDLILTSYLKKSAAGTYTYDVILSLQNLSGKKIKQDFILHSDGVKAEHGFVSMTPNDNQGFFVSWLDGRNTLDKEANGHHKPMTIRFAEITEKGDIINESELDASTCDCCQTSIKTTQNGPIVVYRDRSKQEVRDIYRINYKDGVWGASKPVHKDGWTINGCPVNGPKVAVNSSNLAVAWFTAADDQPQVNVSFSSTNGDSFDAPILLNDQDAIGRVDVAFLNKNEVIVSYMEVDDVGTYLRIKKVSIGGEVSKPLTIAEIDGGRNTGVPQLEILNNEIFVVWTIAVNKMNQLKSVKLSAKDI